MIPESPSFSYGEYVKLKSSVPAKGRGFLCTFQQKDG